MDAFLTISPAAYIAAAITVAMATVTLFTGASRLWYRALKARGLGATATEYALLAAIIAMGIVWGLGLISGLVDEITRSSVEELRQGQEYN